MNKALFLDRDGIINVERGDYTYKIEDFKLTIGIVNFLKVAISKGYLLIVVTNQGGIALGRYSLEDMFAVHNYMKELLSNEGINLTDIFYCPHHNSISICQCRKPASKMIEDAITKYDIDRSISLMVGDSERDTQAGKKAGIRTLQIPSNADLSLYIGEL